MTPRLLPAEAYLALKAAARRLISRAGGVEGAAAITRVGKSRLAEYQAPDVAAFTPADVIADLERDVGDPLVTRQLAALAGYDLVPRAAASAAKLDLGHLLRVLTQQLGVLSGDVDEALEDGRLSEAERRLIVEDGQKVEEAARALIGRVLGGQPVQSTGTGNG